MEVELDTFDTEVRHSSRVEADRVTFDPTGTEERHSAGEHVAFDLVEVGARPGRRSA